MLNIFSIPTVLEFLILLFYIRGCFTWKCTCVPYMCQIAQRHQKRCQIPRIWSHRWMWATYGCWKTQTEVLCKSSKCLLEPIHQTVTTILDRSHSSKVVIRALQISDSARSICEREALLNSPCRKTTVLGWSYNNSFGFILFRDGSLANSLPCSR